MSQTAIILPAAVQAVLTVLLLLALGPARSRSMRARGQTITDDDVRLGRNAWSDEATKLSNSYKSQFEVPVLFYAVVGLALVAQKADGAMLALAWGFAGSRIVHAAIHVGPNVVKWRAVVFVVGVAIVLAMWLLLAWRILSGG
ncbi:MAG: MAPEG family protein [Hyphomicrobiaceae bacterium]